MLWRSDSYSLYEPNFHALMENNGGIEKANMNSELVNDAFCNTYPLLAHKVVTRSACADLPQ